jgi:hypothetical protein
MAQDVRWCRLICVLAAAVVLQACGASAYVCLNPAACNGTTIGGPYVFCGEGADPFPVNVQPSGVIPARGPMFTYDLSSLRGQYVALVDGNVVRYSICQPITNNTVRIRIRMRMHTDTTAAPPISPRTSTAEGCVVVCMWRAVCGVWWCVACVQCKPWGPIPPPPLVPMAVRYPYNGTEASDAEWYQPTARDTCVSYGNDTSATWDYATGGIPLSGLTVSGRSDCPRCRGSPSVAAQAILRLQCAYDGLSNRGGPYDGHHPRFTVSPTDVVMSDDNCTIALSLWSPWACPAGNGLACACACTGSHARIPTPTPAPSPRSWAPPPSLSAALLTRQLACCAVLCVCTVRCV